MLTSSELEQLNQRLFEVTLLKRGGIKGGKQPHKLLLLLALADRIASGVEEHNYVPIDQSLKEYFDQYWANYLYNDAKPGNIAMPLTRLPNDGIFALSNIDLHGKESPSFALVRRESPYAWLDEKWFTLFKNPELREAFKENIIQYYFVKQYDRYRFIDPKQDPNLKRQARKIEKRAPPDPKEIYERSIAFRELIEAAHIQDFAISGNDSLPNGIALNPLMHKAFDMGLFTIEYHINRGKPYQIIVSEHLEESEKGALRLRDLHRQPLKQLPEEEAYAPSAEALEWHQEKRFENFLK